MKQFAVIFLLMIIVEGAMAQKTGRPAHHTEDGFRNPFPTYEDRGFGDFLQWVIVDRITGERPEKPDSYTFETVKNDGKALRENQNQFTVTWVGHSSLLIQMDGINILTDPIWSDRCSPVSWAGPRRHVAPGLAFEDLPEIDLVLISHNHYDHLDQDTIERLGNKPLYLVPLGIGAFLESLDISHYEEHDWWDEVTVNGIRVVCTPAQHFSNRSMFDRNKTLWSGWFLQGQSENFYFAGDTGYFPGFAEIRERFGPVNYAALPIGAYLPRWFMSPVHVNPEEAVQAFIDLQAETFIPIHWGTFELADEPLNQPPVDLAIAIEKAGLDPDRFWLMKHGETRRGGMPELPDDTAKLENALP
jgi:N-acyl-phosphatidylethanolamine-hydrolysing phospholipase D